MSFAYRDANGNDDDFSEDDMECYENVRDAVPRRMKTLPSRTEIEYDDDEFEDSGEYEQLPDMDAGEELDLSAARHPPVGSTSSSALGLASTFRRTSSSSASQTFGNSAASEDNDNSFPANTFNQGRRVPNGLPVSSAGGRAVVKGAGLQRNSSSGGVAIEDGLNTTKIINMKSKLKPTASKLFEKTNNKEDSGAGLFRAPALRPPNSGAAASTTSADAFEKTSLENSSSVNVARSLPTSDVGSGLNSVQIKNHISKLRPTLPKNDDINQRNELTKVKSEPSVRDAKKTFPTAQKIPYAVSAATKKNPPWSSAEQSPPPQPWHQTTNRFPAISSPSPSSPSSPHLPIPATPNCRNEPCMNRRQGGPRHEQPWSNGPRSNGPSETSAKASVGRSQAQQPTQATTTGHAPAPKLAAGRSTSVAPFAESVNDNTHSRAFQGKRILHNYDDTGPTNGRVDADHATWQVPTSSLSSQSWYFGNLERDMCENKLDRLINEDGSYVVRDSQRGGQDNPYTLSLVFKRYIYHLNIRQRPDGKFSIGKSKPDEKVFNNVVELVTFHQNNAIELIGDSVRKTPSGKVTLRKCPTKR